MSNTKKGSGNAGRNERWNRIDPSAASDGDIQRVHDELLHQKESPREGFSPVPIFLVFLLSALIVSTAIYTVWRSDDFDQMGYDESRRRLAWVAHEGETEVIDPLIQVGQRVYTQCAACHQQNGQGLPGAFPPLDGTRWVVGSEERLIRVVMHGMTGPIEVKGTIYNGVMPNLGLGDEEIAGVVSFIRQAWSNDADPIAAQDVVRVRQEVGSRTPWSSTELLEQFPLEDPAELDAAVEGGDEPAEAEQPQ